ncbi:MAG: M90 family metallopeptidase [bacterium]
MMLDLGKKRRRELLRRTPLDAAARELLQQRLFCASHFTTDQLAELEGLIQIFLHEKTFEGCNGQVIDDEIRLVIAGHACLLLLGREPEPYPALDSILVYPKAFAVNHQEELQEGVVLEEEQEMLGESWQQGALVLSWEDVQADLADPETGCNVILHEFAHQVDEQSGGADGTPLLESKDDYARWAEVMSEHFEQLGQAVEQEEETFLDPYGAESPAEFFATITESFLLLPMDMRHFHPALYAELRRFYRQDPVLGFAENP